MKSKNKENITKIKFKGPSLGYTDNYPKRTMWQEIASKFSGEFKVKHNSGNELEIHEISIPHKKWEIHISVSDTRPLKFQISFITNFDFKLMLSWEDFIERIIKKFSKPEIEFGRKEFDKKYLIKSNRPELAEKVISKEVQKLMLKYNIYSISYQTDQKIRTSELISVIQRKAGKKEMVIELIEMFKVIINNLERASIIK